MNFLKKLFLKYTEYKENKRWTVIENYGQPTVFAHNYNPIEREKQQKIFCDLLIKIYNEERE